MSNKQRILYAIQMYDFYLYELQLYLDTHPACRNGLAAYKKYKELSKQAKDMYERSFGPLLPSQSECEDVFEWAKGPWPWEKEAN